MAAKLVAEEGIQKGIVLSLENGEEWVVGRDPDQCSFSIEDPSASRTHLVLRQTAEGILIENLSETNPTQVNGKNLITPLLLNQGDTVKVGNSIFRYYSTPEAQITEKDEEVHDTIFDAEEERAPKKNELAHIDFDFMGGGRFLLKVISGPNNGAEYNMQDSSTYSIGTDPSSCDIVFHDNSVSRQHARITIDEEGNVMIQDLKSRNGTIVDGKKIETPQKLQTNTVVSTGTTSFLIFDRESEMQTIVSPILPSIVKALKSEEEPKKKEEEQLKGPSPEVIEAAKAALESQVIKPAKEKAKSAFGAFMLIGIITGIFVIAGIGTMMLFKSEPVVAKEEVDTDKLLKEAFQPFPGVKYTFTKSTGRLLMVGHVLTSGDKSQLLYNLQGLPFIKGNPDDSGVIIDEFVWRNLNQILSKNPLWKSITLTSPRPGHFVLTGYLKTRKDAEDLSDYINTHFEYLDLLDKKVVVEEDVANAITIQMRNHGFTSVTAEMNNGVVTLSGTIPPDKTQLFATAVTEIKKMPEVRTLKNLVQLQELEKSIINISDKYKVSGVSQIGTNLSVVINGRILNKGDTLDGMLLTDITRNRIMLEKDNIKYQIDY